MQCSCGCSEFQTMRMEEDDGQHGEIRLKTVRFCTNCGRMFNTERPICNTHPTKEERAGR